MKVKLLEKVGTHEAGVILDVDGTIVLQLEKDGRATRYLEAEMSSIPVVSNKEVNETDTKVEEEPESQTVDAETAITYKDSTGKTYTEEEVLKMDKRTNLYKEIISLSK